jgi:predicted esterase
VLQLSLSNRVIDEKTITITAVTKDEHHSYTFISALDGSVQYYSVAPQKGGPAERPAMFLSVHGAGVEAIGQARAYKSKDWGVVIAPTNRRPRGFNWEDWGRLDGLEVLELAKKRYNPDPARIYLTGHSMGGHGTWYLGATYPEKWAAIAPCAGYPSLMAYGSSDGKIPRKATSTQEEVLLRASNPSNVIDLAKNYKGLGIYVHHGDSDKVVSVDYARQMREILATFHSDFSYYEYPGGSHWFGNESVDWPPLFDFFKWHVNPPDSAVDVIDFITANPAISSTHRWVSVIQQHEALQLSKVHLVRSKRTKTIKGNTENIATLKLNLNVFDSGDTVHVVLDSINVKCVVPIGGTIYLSGYPHWKVQTAINLKHKNPARYGTFKEAFNHTMVFVFGTKGDQQEDEWAYNKARYDAEVWYYRGNGSIDIVADIDFKPENFKDRGVIIYGNADTNGAWDKLLKDCPIRVSRVQISLGTVTYKGSNLGAYFTWPRDDSHSAMVGVVTGTGLQGMHAAEANQYFAAGSGFPDFLIFTAEILTDGHSEIKAAGFYDNQWKLKELEVVK